MEHSKQGQQLKNKVTPNWWTRLMAWYRKYRHIHVAISAILFATQIVHLIWLAGNAVFPRLLDVSFFQTEGYWEMLIAGVDYLEIPAIITTSLLYIGDLSQRFSWQKIRFLAYINSQWLHLYWITDEVVLRALNDSGSRWPAWLAWGAILIDYLELPVIYDTSKQFINNLKAGQSNQTQEEAL